MTNIFVFKNIEMKSTTCCSKILQFGENTEEEVAYCRTKNSGVIYPDNNHPKYAQSANKHVCMSHTFNITDSMKPSI